MQQEGATHHVTKVTIKEVKNVAEQNFTEVIFQVGQTWC